jgi:hypothetical protein
VVGPGSHTHANARLAPGAHLFPSHRGRGSIGPGLIAFEASSRDALHVVAQRLGDRQSLAGRTRTDTWEAIFGLDPDRIETPVAASLTGLPIQGEDWDRLDDSVYSIGV